jgi:hypothetical protein
MGELARKGDPGGALRRHSTAKIWPWGEKTAIVLVPMLLFVLFSGLAIMRAVTGMPSAQYEGSVLPALAVISVLPLILLVVQRLAAEGGSFELASSSFPSPARHKTQQRQCAPRP